MDERQPIKNEVVHVFHIYPRRLSQSKAMFGKYNMPSINRCGDYSVEELREGKPITLGEAAVNVVRKIAAKMESKNAPHKKH